MIQGISWHADSAFNTWEMDAEQQVPIDGKIVTIKEVYVHPKGMWILTFPDGTKEVHYIEHVKDEYYKHSTYGLFVDYKEVVRWLYCRWKDKIASRHLRSTAAQIKRLKRRAS